jgi:hypothetical protein
MMLISVRIIGCGALTREASRQSLPQKGVAACASADGHAGRHIVMGRRLALPLQQYNQRPDDGRRSGILWSFWSELRCSLPVVLSESRLGDKP